MVSDSVQLSGLQPARLSLSIGFSRERMLEWVTMPFSVLIITAHKKGKADLFCLHISSPNQHCSSASRNSSVRVTLIRRKSLAQATPASPPFRALHRSPSISFPPRPAKLKYTEMQLRARKKNSATNNSHEIRSNRSPTSSLSYRQTLHLW